MADYNYDESGSMFAYFLMSFLAIVLIPTTFSSLLNQRELDNFFCVLWYH